MGYKDDDISYRDKGEPKTISMPIVKDRMDDVLDYILIVPLFGDQYRFNSVVEVIKFIEEVPEKSEHCDMPFMMFEIHIKFQSGNEQILKYRDKPRTIAFLKLWFEIE